MKTFLETVAGLGIAAVLFIGGALGIALVQGDTAKEVTPLVAWATVTLLVSLMAYAISKSLAPSAAKTHADEDLSAKEHNRKVALALSESGGMLGISARQWINAYDKDPTVPVFGVRPYWTPTGPSGSPQLLSMIGLRGIDDRLSYVREAAADDSLLPIMANDPNRRVRAAVIARMR